MERYRRLLQLKKQAEPKKQNVISELKGPTVKMSDWDDDDEPVTTGRSFDGGDRGYSNGIVNENDGWGDENGTNDDAWNGGGGASNNGGHARGRLSNGAEEIANFGTIDDCFSHPYVIPQDFRKETVLKFTKYLPNFLKNANFIETLCVQQYLKKVYSEYLNVELQKEEEQTNPNLCSETGNIEREETPAPLRAEPFSPSHVYSQVEKEQIADKLREDFIHNLQRFGRPTEVDLSSARKAFSDEKRRKAADQFWKEKEQTEPGLVKFLQERARKRIHRERVGFANLLEEMSPRNENITLDDFANADRRRVGLSFVTNDTSVHHQQHQQQEEAIVSDDTVISGRTKMNLRPRRVTTAQVSVLPDESFAAEKSASVNRTLQMRQSQRQQLATQKQFDEKFMSLRTEFGTKRIKSMPQQSRLRQIVQRCRLGSNFTFVNTFYSKTEQDANENCEYKPDTFLKFIKEKALKHQIAKMQLVSANQMTESDDNAIGSLPMVRDMATSIENSQPSYPIGKELNTTLGQSISVNLPKLSTPSSKQRIAFSTPTLRTDKVQSSTPINLLGRLNDISEVPSPEINLTNEGSQLQSPRTLGPSATGTAIGGQLPVIPEQYECELTQESTLSMIPPMLPSLPEELHEQQLPQQSQESTKQQLPQQQQEHIEQHLPPLQQQENIAKLAQNNQENNERRINRSEHRNWFDVLRERNEQVLYKEDQIATTVRQKAIGKRNRRRQRLRRRLVNVQFPVSQENAVQLASNVAELSTAAGVNPLEVLLPASPLSVNPNLFHNGVEIQAVEILAPLDVMPKALNSTAGILPGASNQNSSLQATNLENAQVLHENFLIENIESVKVLTDNSDVFEKMMTAHAKECANNETQPHHVSAVYDPETILAMDESELKIKLYILEELITNNFFDFHRLPGLQKAEERSIASEFLKDLCSVGMVEILDDGHKVALR